MALRRARCWDSTGQRVTAVTAVTSRLDSHDRRTPAYVMLSGHGCLPDRVVRWVPCDCNARARPRRPRQPCVTSR